jgi:hypothetical protein
MGIVWGVCYNIAIIVKDKKLSKLYVVLTPALNYTNITWKRANPW